MSGLEVEDLSVTYPGTPPVPALRGVTFSVPDAAVMAVLGPSGCGKTTLLRVIAGLEQPSAGRVTMDGTVFDDGRVHVRPEHRRIGLVPQDGALFPHLDVAGNIAFGLRKVPSLERQERVEEMLAMVDLEGYGSRRPDQLSGGQQQRVALARALAHRPSMVLLDEPFSALDSGLRADVRAHVARLLRSASITSLIVTHDETEALEMADTVAVLRSGTLVQIAPPSEIYRNPADTWVGRFLGDAIVLPGEVRDGRAICALGEVELRATRADGPATLLVRPEQIATVLRRSDGEPSSLDATPTPTSGVGVGVAAGVAAIVTDVRFRGAEAAVDLAVGTLSITINCDASRIPTRGDTLLLSVVGPAVAFDPQP